MIKKEIKEQRLVGSKKSRIIIVANITLIILLLGYVIYMYTNNPSAKKDSLDGVKKIDEVTVEQLMSEADESMINVYRMLIQGSDFELENGMEFRFGTDNSFSGYFNSENTDVEDYSFDIVKEDSEAIRLKIYSPDKKTFVQYEMNFDKNGNILLTYPGIDTLVLSY